MVSSTVRVTRLPLNPHHTSQMKLSSQQSAGSTRPPNNERKARLQTKAKISIFDLLCSKAKLLPLLGYKAQVIQWRPVHQPSSTPTRRGMYLCCRLSERRRAALGVFIVREFPYNRIQPDYCVSSVTILSSSPLTTVHLPAKSVLKFDEEHRHFH